MQDRQWIVHKGIGKEDVIGTSDKRLGYEQDNVFYGYRAIGFKTEIDFIST